MSTNLIEHFGIKTTMVTDEKVVIEVEISEHMHQPFGMVHGGFNAVLVETAASIGGNHQLKSGHAVGLEVNVNHVKSKRTGKLIAVATPKHVGRSTQVWLVDIVDEKTDLIATGRMTLQNIE